MSKVQVFDPPDVLLHGRVRPPGRSRAVRFAADLEWLKANGVAVERFNLSQEPAAFVGNPVVAQAIRGRDDALPLLLVDGKIAAQGRYPARGARRAVGVAAPKTKEGPDACRAPAEAAPDALGGSASSPSVAEGEMDLVRLATRHLFFTGHMSGRPACATAIGLADAGKRVLLVSTDPASNLDEVLGASLGTRPVAIPGVLSLHALNLDPEAARAYRERVVGPYRGLLPPAAVRSMEEQLSGACTVEIAAFDEFARLLGEPAATAEYDHVLFDTAPTGHTRGCSPFPSAWTGFVEQSVRDELPGPLAGLEKQRVLYDAT